MNTDGNTENKKDDGDVIDMDDGTVISGEETAGGTVEKLRLKLKQCEKERKEYLDGWKRSRADAVNGRKRQQLLVETERTAALGRYALAMLPVLDSIHAAKDDGSDSDMRAGIEGIRTQCMQAFAALGVEILNPIGEAFDPHQHQAVGERETDDPDMRNTVVEVVRVGARIGNGIIRPAMVYVGTHAETEPGGEDAA